MRLKTATAVILAAGNGTRLKGKHKVPKPLVKVCGLSLAERTVAQLRDAGVRRFVVVLGNQAETVRAHFEKVLRRRDCEGVFVLAPDWEKGNGCSAAAAAPYVKGRPFVLTMVDHLLSPGMIKELLSNPPASGRIMLAVDRSPAHQPDEDDLTKVSISRGRVVDIGKDLESWDAGDTGLFYCTDVLFEGLEAARSRGRYSLTDGVRWCARLGAVRAVDVTGQPWIDVDTPEAYAEAERLLASSIGKTGEDGYVSQRINRPLSRRISLLLARTPLTPNQITLASFAVALAGAFFLRAESALAWAVGGILIQSASVLDGCDGEIARLKLMGSARGAWLDTLLDRYADVAVGGAIVASAARVAHSPGVWLLGILAVSSFLFASYVTKEHELRFGVPYPHNALNRLKKRDLRIACLAAGAVAGRPFETLIALGLFTHLVVAAIMIDGWLAAQGGRRPALPEPGVPAPEDLPVRGAAGAPRAAALDRESLVTERLGELAVPAAGRESAGSC